MSERWFDAEYSDTYYGAGHQDKAAFAAWVNEEERDVDPNSEPSFVAEQVEHVWAVWVDDEPHEQFEIVKGPGFPGALPLTRVRP